MANAKVTGNRQSLTYLFSRIVYVTLTGTGSAGPEVDRTGVTLSAGLKVKTYGIWVVGNNMFLLASFQELLWPAEQGLSRGSL